MSAATQVWSCGGGTQSGAIASLIRLGKLPRPDYAFMTDTGREARVYRRLLHMISSSSESQEGSKA